MPRKQKEITKAVAVRAVTKAWEVSRTLLTPLDAIDAAEELEEFFSGLGQAMREEEG